MELSQVDLLSDTSVVLAMVGRGEVIPRTLEKCLGESSNGYL